MFNKIVWSEGMFLHPQHFQQQDRYVHFLLKNQLSQFSYYNWGFESLELDEEFLKLGKISLKECHCIFPDGTFLNTNFMNKDIEPLEIKPGTVDTLVYIAVPMHQWGEQEVSDQDNIRELIRYKAHSLKVRDYTSEDFNDIVELQVAIPQVKFLTDTEQKASFCYLVIAKIKECITGFGIQLDSNFTPTPLNVKNFSLFKNYIQELFSLIHHRVDVLSNRISEIEKGGISEISDFLLLQLMNRYECILYEFLNIRLLHPYELYKILIQLLGELSTFTSKEKRVVKNYDYNHENIAATFKPLMVDLRTAFLKVLNQNAHSLQIEQHKSNLWIAKINDYNLLETSDFIIAVHAEINSEELIDELPKNFKIGPFEEIVNLVTYALPGIGLQLLATVPRKIPFNKGYTYFVLDKANPLWNQLYNSKGIGFHLSKIYSDFKFEIWIIPDSSFNS